MQRHHGENDGVVVKGALVEARELFVMKRESTEQVLEGSNPSS